MAEKHRKEARGIIVCPHPDGDALTPGYTCEACEALQLKVEDALVEFERKGLAHHRSMVQRIADGVGAVDLKTALNQERFRAERFRMVARLFGAALIGIAEYSDCLPGHHAEPCPRCDSAMAIDPEILDAEDFGTEDWEDDSIPPGYFRMLDGVENPDRPDVKKGAESIRKFLGDIRVCGTCNQPYRYCDCEPASVG